MQTRTYLPVTVAQLRRLGTEGSLGPAPLTAYAVTSDLRREHPSADGDVLEYLAFSDCTHADEGGVPVVVAADLDEQVVIDRPTGGPRSLVRVTVPVPRRQVASFHVAEPSGGSAAGSSRESSGRGGDYSWYDATELDVVLDLLG